VKPHPAAALFPMLPSEEMRALAEDIKANGQKLPIIVTRDDLVLDGRNRLKACQLAGVAPKVETWTGRSSPFAYVRSVNLRRREMASEVKAAIALRLAALEQQSSSAPGRTEGYRLAAIAEQSGVGLRTLERTNRLQKEAPELVDEVIAGRATLKDQEAKLARKKRGVPEPTDADEDSDERYTTLEQYQLCLRLAGVKKLELDVAACKASHLCRQYFTKGVDGLVHVWNRPWWCNPPWSNIRPFVEEAFRAPAPGLMLLPSWTDRGWWQELVEPARDMPHGHLWTRFLPRAPFGSPSNPTAKGVEQPEFWCVLLVFGFPQPKRARDMGSLQRVDVPRGSTKGSKTA
jgi:hypothetical protein